MPEDMSQVSANYLLQDVDGLLWIGSADGLIRFHGKLFKNYQSNPNHTASNIGNFIIKIAETGNEKLWVGTIGNRLNIIDKNTDSFIRTYLDDGTNEENITGIAPVDSNEFWVAKLTNIISKVSCNDYSLWTYIIYLKC